MVYHCTLSPDSVPVACGCALMPLNTKTKGPALTVDGIDVVTEAIEFFRANVLFRNFEAKGAADKLLVYLTLYISACLKKLAEEEDQQTAEKKLFTLAHEQVKLPGDPAFPLEGLLTPPQDKKEEDLFRAYLRQCREEIGIRLVQRCYIDGAPNKYWLAYAQRRFINKTL